MIKHHQLKSDESQAVHKFGAKIFICNAEALAVECEGYFKDEKIKTIVFDVENVHLCDSYGLRFLIQSERKAAAAGKRLLLYRPDSVLKEILSTMNLLQFFTIVDS